MKPKPSPAERAAAHAVAARDYRDALGSEQPAKPTAQPEAGQPGPQPERAEWTVYKPGIAEPFEVVVHPPQTQRDMITIVYPGCGVIPR